MLSTKIYPPIILNDNEKYVMGLIDFMTYNTVPNIDKTNNKFYIGNYEITLHEGTYEVQDIEKTIQAYLVEHEEKFKETPPR